MSFALISLVAIMPLQSGEKETILHISKSVPWDSTHFTKSVNFGSDS